MWGVWMLGLVGSGISVHRDKPTQRWGTPGKGSCQLGGLLEGLQRHDWRQDGDSGVWGVCLHLDSTALLLSLELRSTHTENRRTSRGDGEGGHRDRKVGEGRKWGPAKHPSAVTESPGPVGRLLEFTAGLMGGEQVWVMSADTSL